MGNSHSATPRRLSLPRRRNALPSGASSSANPEPLQLFLKPSGLYPGGSAWSDKLVRRLILRRDLAPRYPGRDDADASAREECPICMLVYPSLNSLKCCGHGVCTECFLQLRPPRHAKEPCPFCKHRKIEVVFRGVRDTAVIEKEERDAKAAAEAAAKAAAAAPPLLVVCPAGARAGAAAAPDGERQTAAPDFASGAGSTTSGTSSAEFCTSGSSGASATASLTLSASSSDSSGTGSCGSGSSSGSSSSGSSGASASDSSSCEVVGSGLRFLGRAGRGVPANGGSSSATTTGGSSSTSGSSSTELSATAQSAVAIQGSPLPRRSAMCPSSSRVPPGGDCLCSCPAQQGASGDKAAAAAGEGHAEWLSSGGCFRGSEDASCNDDALASESGSASGSGLAARACGQDISLQAALQASRFQPDVDGRGGTAGSASGRTVHEVPGPEMRDILDLEMYLVHIAVQRSLEQDG